ncbi:potassium channel family protein [Bacillus timonensis]|nr:potassium channel family protein [Bacillus timonensis]
MKAHSLAASFLRWPIIGRVLTIIGVVVFLFGTVIHFLEPETFPTLFDGIWWAIVTTSTVGYGDFVPESTIGRIVTILLILGGTGFVTYYFVTLSATAVSNQNAYVEGKISYKGNKHVLIVGWNERVRETITQLTAIAPSIEILLIDETLDRNPHPTKNIHFIKGNPTLDETLERANVQQAEMVVITADQNKDEVHSDMASILTLVAMKGINPNIYSIVEILTSQQVNNAKRAGADEIIRTNHLSSYVMINSVVSHGMSDALLTMLDQLKGSKLKFIVATHDLIGKTFSETSSCLLHEKKLLLGIKRGCDSYVNPDLSMIIEKNDELLVISN